MNLKLITYSKHALKRARERKLWKYVSKEKFFYDALHSGGNTAKLQDCIYAYKWEGDKILILTMYNSK